MSDCHLAAGCDISDLARPIVIGGSLDLIERGHHREAMFWIAVTHCRCRRILSGDAPEHVTTSFNENCKDLFADLGLHSLPERRQRATEIEQSLPALQDMAERIMETNRGVEA